MDPVWNPDEVARTSDEAAVRKRFDERNLRWLVAMLIFFTIASFLEIVTEHRSNLPLEVLFATTNLAVVAGLLFAIWSPRSRPWMKQRVSAIVVTYVAVQYALTLGFTSRGTGWVPWVVTFPFMILMYRMLVSELALIHAILAGGGVFMAFVGKSPEKDHGFFIAVISINVATLLAELWLSRRLRREIVGEWTRLRMQAREQVRMRDELRYARELQLSMLPECAPDLDWIDICATSLPATEVGGDYYDYFVGEDHVAIISGDVAGHGMSAGLVLAAVRAGFTILRENLDDPATVLRRLHGLVSETSRRRMLVTVSVLLIHRDQRSAVIASAGHPPIFVRRNDGSVEAIDLFAAPLGVRLPVTIPQRRLDVASGDVFVLHSDGIYETRNSEGEIYGLERLGHALRFATGERASEILDTILRDVTEFRGSVELEDDVTLVVARIR